MHSTQNGAPTSMSLLRINQGQLKFRDPFFPIAFSKLPPTTAVVCVLFCLRKLIIISSNSQIQVQSWGGEGSSTYNTRRVSRYPINSDILYLEVVSDLRLKVQSISLSLYTILQVTVTTPRLLLVLLMTNYRLEGLTTSSLGSVNWLKWLTEFRETLYVYQVY